MNRFLKSITRSRACVAAALCVAAGSAAAQEFPTRPIHSIVPYAAGTGSDVASRKIAPSLTERLKQQILVENRPGAGASIGVAALKNAAPDGYTMGVLVSANAAAPWLVKETPFDIRKDFAPITTLYKGALAMIVPANHPAKSLAEFIEHGKRSTKGIFTGAVGIGTTSFLAGELVKIMGGYKGTTINYKGSPEMDSAVVAGDVEIAFDNYATPRALVEAGRLRVLATSGLALVFWTGYAAPRGTPHEIIVRLNREIAAVHPHTLTLSIDRDSITCKDRYSERLTVLRGIDTVVLAMGNLAEDALAHALAGRVSALHSVGDCLTPRRIDDAIREGERVGWMI